MIDSSTCSHQWTVKGGSQVQACLGCTVNSRLSRQLGKTVTDKTKLEVAELSSGILTYIVQCCNPYLHRSMRKSLSVRLNGVIVLCLSVVETLHMKFSGRIPIYVVQWWNPHLCGSVVESLPMWLSGGILTYVTQSMVESLPMWLNGRILT